MDIQTLLTRRSSNIKTFNDEGIDRQSLELILNAGTRVPDHGRLNPWWFVVFEGKNRETFGEVLAQAWLQRDPQATPQKLDDERARLMHAPLVIAVISRPRQSLIPIWEQQLSAGAVCYNIMLAANALGYGTNWLTGWYSFDDNVRAALKLEAREQIAGFIHIGNTQIRQDERERPKLDMLVNMDWQNTTARGDAYEKEGVGFDIRGSNLKPFLDKIWQQNPL